MAAFGWKNGWCARAAATKAEATPCTGMRSAGSGGEAVPVDVAKEMFLNHLYDGMDDPDIKIIHVFICKLRKKLADVSDGEHYIETNWGRGFMLRDHEENGAAAA